VNFADAVSCKRCHTSLVDRAADHQPSRPETISSAAPRSSSGSGVRREGKLVVVTEDSEFPDRCVRCNAPATKQLKRKLYWAPNYIAVIAAFSWVFGGMLLVNKCATATIHIGLCQSHFNRRFFGLTFGGSFIAIGLLMGVVTIFNGDQWLLVYGGASLLIGAFLTVILTPTVTADRIEDPFVWLKGAGPAFLKSL
jgi:hypothetical protein